MRRWFRDLVARTWEWLVPTNRCGHCNTPVTGDALTRDPRLCDNCITVLATPTTGFFDPTWIDMMPYPDFVGVHIIDDPGDAF